MAKQLYFISFIFAAILIVSVIPAASAAYVNSKDDLYLKINHCDYKIPVKARFIRSDYGAIKHDNGYLNHAYYTKEGGYSRYIIGSKQLTREFSQYEKGPTEPYNQIRSNHAGIRKIYAYHDSPETTFNYYSNCNSIFRNQDFTTSTWKKVTTVDVEQIAGIKQSKRANIIKQRPHTIRNSPDEFHYRPREQTTLDKTIYYNQIPPERRHSPRTGDYYIKVKKRTQ